MDTAPDLTNQAPRSPRLQVGGYVVLARAIDKCRADLAGTIGEYHTDCPIDKILLGWKEIEYSAFREQVASGSTDEQIAEWVSANGAVKSPIELQTWNEETENFHPATNPDLKEFFLGECERLELDPATTTLFDYLEKDDALSFS